MPWARPGGPARELAWAEQVLDTCGRTLTGRPHQRRTWNLSSIWTIPTDAGTVWLKSVPPFFAHEGAIIDWLAEPVLPPLLGFASGRVLMADIPGSDQYDASLATLQRAVDDLVAIQQRVSTAVDELRRARSRRLALARVAHVDHRRRRSSPARARTGRAPRARRTAARVRFARRRHRRVRAADDPRAR